MQAAWTDSGVPRNGLGPDRPKPWVVATGLGWIRLAESSVAATPPAAIIVDAAAIVALLATDILCAQIRDLRAQLIRVTAPLPAAIVVTGLAQLPAPVPARTAAAVIVPVPVVPARGFGVFLAQADSAKEPQRRYGRATDRETETTPRPPVELRVFQLCSSGGVQANSAQAAEIMECSGPGMFLPDLDVAQTSERRAAR